ncbi:MAG: CPBP family intramembrane metalloprotease [Anaerolineae bacterium]|nr:CPBP family intramembrane metalloprotease [Anaerolineae bacterium]
MSTLQRFIQRVRTPEAFPAPPWGVPLGLGLGLAYLVVIFAAVLLVATLTDADSEDLASATLAGGHLLACLVMLLLFWQYTSLALSGSEPPNAPTLDYRQALRWGPSRSTPIGSVMLVSLALAAGLDTAGLVLGVPLDSLPTPLDDLPRAETGAFLAALVVVVVLRPLVEELIFRGVLYTTLRQRMSVWAAVVLSSAIFAALHYAYDPTYLWWGLVQPLVLGLVAGLVRASTQSTQAALASHAMFGFFVMLRALLA